MIEYTREEAVRKVLEMKAKLGHIPTEIEYKKDNTIDLKDLEKALGVDSYAGVNIAVLRELRKQESSKMEVGKMSKKVDVLEVEEEKAAKKRDYKVWTKEEVARIIDKFYNIKGKLPTNMEISYGVLREVCGEHAPSTVGTISRHLGAKADWLNSVKQILGQPIIIQEKQKDTELISEDEEECYQCIDLEQFFKTAEAVRAMVEDGSLKKIQEAANQFNFETKVRTEKEGLSLYFIAKFKKE